MLEGWGEGQVSYWKQIFQALASHGRRKGASLAGDLESEEFYMVFWFWLNSAPSFMHMDKGILREDDVENSPPPPAIVRYARGFQGSGGRREDGRDEGQKLRGGRLFKVTQIHFSFFSFSEIKRMSSCVIDNLLTFLL